MSTINIIILAIVQGLTEYLPISSTAHLLIAQKLLDINPNVFFTVVLQFGTLLSSIFYFRKKIFKIGKDTIVNVKNREIRKDLGLKILVGIIPVIVIGFFAGSYLDRLYSKPIIIVFTTIFFGALFYFVELLYKKTKERITIENIGLKNIIYIGFAQVLSIVPGVSRSGSTIAGGLAQKIDFKDSIEISFLMSIPVMIGATCYELIKSFDYFNPQLALNLLIGIIISFLAGLISIKITLGFVRKNGFLPFLIYRVIFAIFILLILN